MDKKLTPATQQGSETHAAAMRRVQSEALLGPRRELVIVHNGREYHLRQTQNGKLILTA